MSKKKKIKALATAVNVLIDLVPTPRPEDPLLPVLQQAIVELKKLGLR